MTSPAPSEPVRIGLLGTGAVAQVAHLPAYRHLRNVDLIALCDNEKTKLRALKDRTGVSHAVSSIDELLAIDEVEAVDICLPSDLHRDAVIRCLEAGRHVLCEKPLALTPVDVQAIVDAQRSSGKILLVGMNNRYRGDSILLKSFIEDNALGDVFYARAGWLKRRDAFKKGAWHYQRSRAGGGVLMDLGVQLLDLTLWFCGYPEPERVVAQFSNLRPDVDVEDTAVAMLKCAGGLTITLEASWHFLMDSDRQFLNLFGTDGSGLLNPIRVFQRMHDSLVNVTPQGQPSIGNIYMESYEREIAFFGEVAAGREETPPLDEQITLARALAAIQRSAGEGREVMVKSAPEAATQ
jgi:predicted dehydrogenase